MCRLFAQLARTEQSAYDFLVEQDFSLLKQSDYNRKHPQKDGWGIGRWRPADGIWEIEKSEKAVFQEKQLFREKASAAKSEIVVAHIRHASNPKKLSQKQLIGRKNSQPFSYQNLIFVHNGTLNIPDEVAASLGSYEKMIRGSNDSEVLFWLFVKIVQDHRLAGSAAKLWRDVFGDFIGHIRSVWERIPKSRRKTKRPFRGLNCIAGDGKTLAAHCYSERAEGQSLCGQNRPYFEMCYNIQPDRIALASEPMDQTKNWKPIPNKHLLVVGNRLSVSILKL